jgi:ABC-2 type transport system ATP-binding protein
VALPGLVAPVEAGNRLLVSISTTDQAYTARRPGGVADRAGRGGRLTLPDVPGDNVTASTVPSGR